MHKQRTKVLIVDDSALMRELISGILAEDPEIDVVGAAPDPFVAWEQIKATRPDVLTLDVEMPRMDGLTFLHRLTANFPMPVVMVSALSERGAELAVRALELGAVEVIAKPSAQTLDGLAQVAKELVVKVKAAGRARLRSPAHQPPMTGAARGDKVVQLRQTWPGRGRILAIGASTGGTEALREVLTSLPADAPATVVVQHMPEMFTRAFAERLDGLCRMRVKEAADSEPVLPGHVYIAPGNHHMRIVRLGSRVSLRVDQEPPVNRHRPSVDVLFESCASYLGSKAVGAILTGMGSDGARGMLAMRQAGAHTIAQDESTSVVFGMPKEAIACGGATEVLPLSGIAAAALAALGRS